MEKTIYNPTQDEIFEAFEASSSGKTSVISHTSVNTHRAWRECAEWLVRLQKEKQNEG